MTVEIHSGSPTGALLSTSFTMNPPLPSGFIPFTFSSPAAVVAGSVYAIVIHTSGTNDGGGYAVSNAGPGPYAAGDEWNLDRFAGWILTCCPLSDLAFKTYVATAPPSPTAVGGVVLPANTLVLVAPWLTIIGLVGCVGTAVVVAKKRRP